MLSFISLLTQPNLNWRLRSFGNSINLKIYMLKFTPVRALLFLSIIAISCKEETDLPSPQITVQFESGSLNIDENGEEQSIKVVLSSPAPGSTLIPVTADVSTAFTSIPPANNGVINVFIEKGTTEGVLKIKPTDNSNDEADRTVSLSFGTLPSRFVAGQQPAFAITIRDDDAAPVQQSVANILEAAATLHENDGAGITYVIQLSRPAAVDSKLMVAISSETAAYARHYTVEPEPVGGSLELSFAAGQQTASFRVLTVPNAEATGELALSVNITGTTGSLVKGPGATRTLRLIDDELLNKPKGYFTSRGGDSYEVTYEYDLQGRVARRLWTSKAYFTTTGVDTYYYDGNGLLTRINKYPGRDVNYLWNGGRITRSEETQDGVVKSYTIYDYDEQGNVAGAMPYYRQTDDTFAAGIFTVYLYFTDGNVYKSLTYQPIDGGEPVLLRTRTYDSYTTNDNPFPMVEILPNVVSQKKLPGFYEVEENGTTETYHLTYRYDGGLLVERTASGNAGTQVATYQYY